MIPPNDPRWKVSIRTVKLPFRFGPHSMSLTPSVTMRDLERKGVHAPYDPAGLFVTEPSEKREQALKEGEAHMKDFKRSDVGNMAEVIALIRSEENTSELQSLRH